jgi:signal transduction histidine kinase
MDRQRLVGGGTQDALESVDERMVGAMRLLLALSALLVIYIDPSEPDRVVTIIYTTLALYCVYSGVLYYGANTGRPLLPFGEAHWVDVCWYVLLIALSSGTNSVFFFFFFFAILTAAFRKGYLEGMRVTVVSVLFFTVIGFATAPHMVEFELNRYLLHPLYLGVLGYMISFWGGCEITFKRRLALLKDVNTLSNPRFGIDHTVGSILKRVREFYEADACGLVVAEGDPPSYTLRWADADRPGRASYAEPVSEEMLRLSLLALPPDYALVFDRRPTWWRRDPGCYALDTARGTRCYDASETCEALADMLGTRALVTVPVRRRVETVGRLYLTSRKRSFGRGELDFLRQLLEHIAPVIENVQLLDHLATEAAELERRRLSLDIHDSAVQPYIGLKLGLDALLRKAGPDSPLYRDINSLLEQASASLSDLRGFVRGMKGEGHGEHGKVLLPALRRQADKFHGLYGIKVEVDSGSEVVVSDRLAAAVFQIVREGLTNVRRHTRSQRARVSVTRAGQQLVVSVENEREAGEPRADFTPRSITERAEALGGVARVAQEDGLTSVTVEIPL